MNWIDIVSLLIVGWFAFRGYKRGLIGTIFGLVAIVAGIVAVKMLPDMVFGQGSADKWGQWRWALVPVCFAVGYIGVISIGRLLGRGVNMTPLGVVNRAGGIALSMVSAAVVVLLFVSVAYFSNLAPDAVRQSYTGQMAKQAWDSFSDKYLAFPTSAP